MYQFCETKKEHVDSLKGRLRDSDKMEIQAFSGRDPDAALEHSAAISSLCWTAIKNGKVIAIFGAAGLSVMSTNGCPWMLGSEELNCSGIEIVRISRYYVGEMKKRFPFLENYIDARQKRSIRWLKWCGFTVEPAIPFGIEAKLFHRFYL